MRRCEAPEFLPWNRRIRCISCGMRVSCDDRALSAGNAGSSAREGGADACGPDAGGCAADIGQCVQGGTNAPDGTMCGTDQVCSGGKCIACKAGSTCSVSNPCRTGELACNTGSPVCLEMGNGPNGTMCGTGQVCQSGACVPCMDGANCTPTNACHDGTLSCSGGVPTYKDTGTAVAVGTACWTAPPNEKAVCSGGTCVTQCKVSGTELSCGGTSSPLACASWDFESATTEGWLISTTSSTPMSLLSLSSSTQQSSTGGRSLAVHVAPV